MCEALERLHNAQVSGACRRDQENHHQDRRLHLMLVGQRKKRSKNEPDNRLSDKPPLGIAVSKLGHHPKATDKDE